MPALVAAKRNAVIRAFHERLVAASKLKTRALVACMRKLLTILNTPARTQQRWSAEYAIRAVDFHFTAKTVANGAIEPSGEAASA